MTQVKTIIAPLFPGVTFADSDQVFLERRSVTVGPAGGQARTAAQSLFPLESLEDDDVIVVETARRAMGDQVVLPGEVLSDDFNGPAGTPANPYAFENPAGLVTNGTGQLLMPVSRTGQGLRFLSEKPMDVATVTVEWDLAVTNGYATSSLFVRKPGDSVRKFGIERGGTSLITHWTNAGLGDEVESITYSATNHRWWRLRLNAGTINFETSPNGTTWTNLRTEVTPTWAADPCDVKVMTSAWHDNGMTAGTSRLGFLGRT